MAARHCKLDRAATRKSANSDIFPRLMAGKSQVDVGDARNTAPEDGAYHLKHNKALSKREETVAAAAPEEK